eukprot:s612_g26.t1
MSLGNEKPVSEAEAKMAREILARFERQSPLVEMPCGSMHDGSKRLRDSDDWDAISYPGSADEFIDRLAGTTVTGKQEPIPVINAKPSEPKPKFPPGISSLSDWGTTICRLPRVAHLNASYEELTKMSDQKQYLKWITDHGASRGGRFEDFHLYLKAMNLPSLSAEHCFPGTTERRERKFES